MDKRRDDRRAKKEKVRYKIMGGVIREKKVKW